MKPANRQAIASLYGRVLNKLNKRIIAESLSDDPFIFLCSARHCGEGKGKGNCGFGQAPPFIASIFKQQIVDEAAPYGKVPD